MPIAVTGAAGFIGSQLAMDLAARLPADGLVLVDHPLTDAKAPNLRGLEAYPVLDHNHFLQAYEAAPEKYPLVYHLGACSSTVETSWEYLLENNLEYSQRLWQGAARSGGRLIYASSAATYGDGSQGFDDEASLEELQPLNLYGKSKHDFDLWVQERNASGDAVPAQCVGLKFFNVWGPGESHKGRMASMAFHAYHQIQESGEVKLFGSHLPEYADGGQLRDFVYVGDVVRVLRALGAAPHVSGLFNVGTGEAISFNTFMGAVFEALGLETNIVYIPMPADLKGKYQYSTEATMKKLAATGVWQGATPLTEAMATYVNYLRRESR